MSGLAYNHSQRTGSGFTFDSNGDATTYAGVAHGWDQENRMTSWGSTATFGYRADGSRAWKNTSAGTTYYVYDDGDPQQLLTGFMNCVEPRNRDLVWETMDFRFQAAQI